MKPTNEHMLFYALGQLIAKHPGEGFIPMYRPAPKYSSMFVHPCNHGSRLSYHAFPKPVAIRLETPVVCQPSHFALASDAGIAEFWVFVGQCPDCGRRYFVHDVEALKDVFASQN